jgi:hypothetical protein
VAGGIRVRARSSALPTARAGNAAAARWGRQRPERSRRGADARGQCRGVAIHRGRSSAQGLGAGVGWVGVVAKVTGAGATQVEGQFRKGKPHGYATAEYMDGR